MMILPAPRSVRRSRNEYLNVSIANQTPRIPPAVQGSFGNRILSGLGRLGNLGQLPPLVVGGKLPFGNVYFPEPPRTMVSWDTVTAKSTNVVSSVFIKSVYDKMYIWAKAEGTTLTSGASATIADPQLIELALGANLSVNLNAAAPTVTLALYAEQLAAWIYLNYRPVMRFLYGVGATKVNGTVLNTYYLNKSKDYATEGSVLALMTDPFLTVTLASINTWVKSTLFATPDPKIVTAIQDGIFYALRLYALRSGQLSTPANFSLDSNVINDLKAQLYKLQSQYDEADLFLKNVMARAEKNGVTASQVQAAQDKVGVIAGAINDVQNRLAKEISMNESLNKELITARESQSAAVEQVYSLVTQLNDKILINNRDLQFAVGTLKNEVQKLITDKADVVTRINTLLALKIGAKALSDLNLEPSSTAGNAQSLLDAALNEYKAEYIRTGGFKTANEYQAVEAARDAAVTEKNSIAEQLSTATTTITELNAAIARLQTIVDAATQRNESPLTSGGGTAVTPTPVQTTQPTPVTGGTQDPNASQLRQVQSTPVTTYEIAAEIDRLKAALAQWKTAQGEMLKTAVTQIIALEDIKAAIQQDYVLKTSVPTVPADAAKLQSDLTKLKADYDACMKKQAELQKAVDDAKKELEDKKKEIEAKASMVTEGSAALAKLQADYDKVNADLTALKAKETAAVTAKMTAESKAAEFKAGTSRAWIAAGVVGVLGVAAFFLKKA